jgi:sulfotransferase family protein
MKQIDLMIIGAQKAGTTALKNYLSEHPGILSHPQTEFAYFVNDTEYKEGFEPAFDRYFDDYKNPEARKIVAKAAAMYYNEESIKRLSLQNPGCKIVFVLREPVARTYSAYQMEVFNGWLKRDFKELIPVIKEKNTTDDLYDSFITKSLYSDHLPAIYSCFPKNQVRLILFEEFKDDSTKVCRELFEWIGVDPGFVPEIGVKHNVSRKPKSEMLSNVLIKLRRNDNILKKIAKKILPYKTFTEIGNSMIDFNRSSAKMDPIDEESRKVLNEFFQPYNKRLEDLSGVDVKGW